MSKVDDQSTRPVYYGGSLAFTKIWSLLAGPHDSGRDSLLVGDFSVYRSESECGICSLADC